jgi:hypothetical protein
MFMGDMFKVLMAILFVIVMMILYKCYVFAQANGIETMVVFKSVMAIIAATGLAAWAASQIGITEGFCFWIVACWICLCPVLGALAEVNSLSPFLNLEARDVAWYGKWWFQWGVGFSLVGLDVFLLKRKHHYY